MPLSRRPRAILFDAVGTLIFADPPVAHVYQQIGARHGVDLSITTISKRFGRALACQREMEAASSEDIERQRWKQIVGEVFCEQHDKAVGPLFEELWTHFAQGSSWRLYDDVPPTLAALRHEGIQLAIASNFDRRLRSICREHGSLAAFDAIFLASEIGFAKPNPAFFQEISKWLNIPSHELLLVGDHPDEDVQGALQASWQAALIDRSTATPSRHIGDEVSIRSLQQLRSLLADST